MKSRVSFKQDPVDESVGLLPILQPYLAGEDQRH